MKIIKCVERSVAFIRTNFLKFVSSLLFVASSKAVAGNNPFPNVDISGGDVVQAAGSKLETTLKYALLGVGGLLVIGSIAVLIHRMREDNRDKEHGNMVMTFIMVALGVTFGFILIAIGWKAFSAQVQ